MEEKGLILPCRISFGEFLDQLLLVYFLSKIGIMDLTNDIFLRDKTPFLP